MKEEKELVVRSDEALAVYEGLKESTPIDTRDLMIPKIVLMQGLSKRVTDDLAKFGEMRDSLSNKLLGDSKNPLEIIPIHVQKAWVIYNKINSKYEYVNQVKRDFSNEDWELEGMVDGIEVRRDRCINYFVLLTEEIADDIYFPYLISFRRTSYNAGKTLETHRAKYEMFKKPVSFSTYNLCCSKEENDKGVYYIFKVSESRRTTPEELEAVKRWKAVIDSKPVAVDNSDLMGDETAPVVEKRENMGEGDRF